MSQAKVSTAPNGSGRLAFFPDREGLYREVCFSSGGHAEWVYVVRKTLPICFYWKWVGTYKW